MGEREREREKIYEKFLSGDLKARDRSEDPDVDWLRAGTRLKNNLQFFVLK
jgi:hypothetical protein